MATRARAPDEEPPYRIESVDKALRLLLMFQERSTWTVSEASEALGVARSTAHRLLAMLQYHGFVTQQATSKAYGPGRALLEIGLAAVRSLDVRRVARPHLEALVQELRETIQLIILQGQRTLIVDAVECQEAVRVSARTGGSAPPNCTSAGKVLLARLPPDEVRGLLGPDPLETLTERSIGTLAELEADLADVRARGYATNLGEHEPGLSAISVAIATPAGVTPAAITVSAPEMRMPPERIPDVVAAAARSAARIAADLERSL